MSATPLIALQAFQVAFLWLHDWVPLGRLNDVAAARRQDPLQRLVKITLLQSVPWTLGLIFSLQFQWPHYPAWLRQWLWISYGILFAGELRAWWYPYLIHADAGRATRYRTLFGNTHAFLPMRNGMVPNTLHVILHMATLATLVLLGWGLFSN